MAGYETTSNALSFCLFVLSKNPHEQEKLVDEIHSVFDSEVYSGERGALKLF